MAALASLVQKTFGICMLIGLIFLNSVDAPNDLLYQSPAQPKKEYVYFNNQTKSYLPCPKPCYHPELASKLSQPLYSHKCCVLWGNNSCRMDPSLAKQFKEKDCSEEKVHPSGTATSVISNAVDGTTPEPSKSSGQQGSSTTLLMVFLSLTSAGLLLLVALDFRGVSRPCSKLVKLIRDYFRERFFTSANGLL